MPTVSIITTVFNREKYLAKAIDSFLTQTYLDAELLIWDDGSTDGSVDIAHHYAEKDPRIRVIEAKHLGRGKALVGAVNASSGNYIGLLDSDDALAFNALEETVQLLDSHSSVGMVYTQYYEMDPKGKIKGIGKQSQIPYSRKRILVDFMVFHFRLMRRSVYDQVGVFDDSFTYAQDYDLCLKFSEQTEIYYMPKPLYFYRKHHQSISCEKQLEQIHFSYLAVSNALKRQDLDTQMQLEVQLNPKFLLRRIS